MTVSRVAGSLRDTPSTFVPVAVPETRWTPVEGGQAVGTGSAESTLQPVAQPAALQSRSPDTSFGATNGADTEFRIFREAEVPRDRLQVTREVLVALQARQTPQQSIVVDLPADVLFDFDRATLRPDAAQALARAAELLRSYPGAPVRINGHTDAKGSDDYNDALSLKRARTVAAALQQDQGRTFPTQGFGKRRPVAHNTAADGSDDPVGRQRNRRVEIVIEPIAPPAGATR
ncbi:OmpA family protein [Xylophilus ampelinus]|nr:OmpA family protein [Xylophilus ampelinus]MCS4509697.1 OmpA family protein [Xylophilus ampelinus]